MSEALLVEAPALRQAVFGRSPDMLSDIYRDDVNLAVWQRAPSPGVAAESKALLADRGATGDRLTLPVSRLDRLESVLPGLVRYPKLAADVRLLADMFSCLFELDRVGLRLAPLTRSMCPKFHVDRVCCRLITTYAGTGTEWLPDGQVDRRKLGTGSGGLSDADSGLYPSPDAIQVLAPGDVALLKGEAWEGNEGAGLVHRSPAVAPGQQRLLLTIDFA
jgi:hypothetical protein